MSKRSIFGMLLILVIAIGITIRIAVRTEKIPLLAAQAESNRNIIDPATNRPAKGGESLIWVYPTKDPKQDRPNIQWALDNITPEGTIVLKAAGLSGEAYFDLNREFQNYTFGNYICRSVTLQGEISSEVYKGGHQQLNGLHKMTMIKNGIMLFGINWSEYCSNSIATKVVIKDLFSQGGRVFWCGAFQECDLEINDVHIVDFAAYPDYPNLIGFFSHAKGRLTVKNSTIHAASAASGIYFGILYAGLEHSLNQGAAVELTNNKIITQGSGVGIGVYNNNDNNIVITNNSIEASGGIVLKGESLELGPAVVFGNKLSNSIPVYIPSARVGIQAAGLHDSIIKNNDVRGTYSKGIELIYSKIRPTINNNTIEANMVYLSNAVDRTKAYVFQDSFWFPASDKSQRIDPTLYPHSRNNLFLNPLGNKENNGFWLSDIDQSTFMRFNPDSNLNLFNVGIDPAPENPHIKAEAISTRFEALYKSWCKHNEGTWDGDKCVY